MALAVPILDVGLSIVRRFLRHQPIFGADYGHIHHRLLDKGFSPRRAALILYGVCGLAAGFSLLQSEVHHRFGGLVIVLFCAATWIGVQHLGYLEFGLASRMLLGGGFLRFVNAQFCLRAFEQSLAAAKSVDDFWLAIREACKTLGFNRVRLYLFSEIYEQQIMDSDSEDCWDLRIPLCSSNYINLSRAFHSPVQPMIVAPFVDALRTGLRSKLEQFEPKMPASSTLATSSTLAVPPPGNAANVVGSTR
jgi:UDP-GlcNAc:undecaprenyl-phosphate GlcNAc-1-phosphate transferase